MSKRAIVMATVVGMGVILASAVGGCGVRDSGIAEQPTTSALTAVADATHAPTLFLAPIGDKWGYIDKTGKYVLWFFCIGTTEPEYPAAMLAVAGKP